MSNTVACPAALDLQRLALGQVTEPEAEALGRHILTCTACARRLEELQANDSLLADLRSGLSHSSLGNPTTVDALVDRLLGDTLPEDTARPEIPGYEILGELGRGGMGVVYKARQQKLNRVVALKMILAGGHAEEQEFARFRTEAEAIARFQHPNIVQVFEVGEWRAAGTGPALPYFSLEFCGGGNLDQKLKGDPMPAGQAAQLVETLARAVQAAHERQVIHRDLKPGNILLTAEGTPKITDFGLAKELDREAERTHTGAIMGTPSYMAPEQARGETSRAGPAADIYALGAILYRCLTGRPPFKGVNSWDTIHKVLHDEPVPPRRLQPRLPRDLETICLKCLRKEPDRRYASALDLAEDLRRFQFGEPVKARRVGRAERLWRWCRRNRTVATLGALVLLCLAVGGGVAAYLVAERDRSDAALSTNQQVDALWKQLDQDLNLPPLDWTPEHADLVKSRLQQLAALDAATGKKGEDKFYAQALPDLFRKLLDEAKIQPEHEKQAQFFVQLMSAHDPAGADKLKKDLAGRLTEMDTVFHLKAPYQQLPAFFQFAGHHIRVEPDQLLSVLPDAKNSLHTVFPTGVSSHGIVAFEAKFQVRGLTGPEIGLMLNAPLANTGVGYAFLLRAKAPPDTPGAPKQLPAAATLGEARTLGLPIVQQIVRDGVVLRERELSAKELPLDQPFVLAARREGGRLTFRVNKLKPLEVYEIFAVPRQGNFALVWPPGAALLEVKAMRQSLPAKLSPLEKGDEFFTRGSYDDAIDEYQRQTQATQNAAIKQEALVKEALAWIEKKRPQDAAPLLEKVANQVGPRWPHVAACQLWLLHLQQKNFAAAQLIISQLLMNKQLERFDELAALIPLDVRLEILGGYYKHQDRFAVLTASRAEREEQIVQLKMVVELERLLEAPPGLRLFNFQTLVRLYRLNDQPQEATQLLKKWLDEEPHDPIRFGHEYIWLLIEQNTPGPGLEYVDRVLATGAQKHYDPIMHLDRARLLIALGQREQAEKAVEAFLRPMLAPPVQAAGLVGLAGRDAWLLTPLLEPDPNNSGSSFEEHLKRDACLLLGFLHADRGDLAGARKISALGTAVNKFHGSEFELGAGVGLFTNIFLGVLSDQMPDAELEKYIDWAMTKMKVPVFLMPQLKKSMPLTQAFRNVVQGPHGFAYARSFAYRQLSYRQLFTQPPELIGTELLCLQAFAGKFTSPQEEKLSRQFVHDTFDLFLEKKLSAGAVLSLGLMWIKPQSQDPAGVLSTLNNALPPPVVGPAAYLFGRRCQQLSRKDLAAAFFRAALQSSPPNSDLHRLAETALRPLDAKGS